MSTEYDTILVPTDGSENAEAAAEHAVGLAEAFDATVRVLNVVDAAALVGGMDEFDAGPEVERALESAGEGAVGTVAGMASEAGLDVTTEVLTGRPHRSIADYAAEVGADLIAMGTHGRTGLERLLLGSVAERVVRTSSVPVLTVAEDGPAWHGSYDEVLVPTDGSECAEAAAEHAVAIAGRYDATVHVVGVVNLIEEGGFFSAGGVNEGFVDELDAEAERATRRIAERVEDAGLGAESAVVHGVPSRVLVDYADENGVDVIAMGTHGRTGGSRYLTGSVTERVVRTAPVPVLTVRHGEDE